MLAAWYKKQMVKEAEERGREEGFAEAWEIWQEWQADVDAWEQRKAAAENEGRDFTEPRPVPPRARR